MTDSQPGSTNWWTSARNAVLLGEDAPLDFAKAWPGDWSARLQREATHDQILHIDDNNSVTADPNGTIILYGASIRSNHKPGIRPSNISIPRITYPEDVEPTLTEIGSLYQEDFRPSSSELSVYRAQSSGSPPLPDTFISMADRVKASLALTSSSLRGRYGTESPATLMSSSRLRTFSSSERDKGDSGSRNNHTIRFLQERLEVEQEESMLAKDRAKLLERKIADLERQLHMEILRRKEAEGALAEARVRLDGHAQFVLRRGSSSPVVEEFSEPRTPLTPRTPSRGSPRVAGRNGGGSGRTLGTLKLKGTGQDSTPRDSVDPSGTNTPERSGAGDRWKRNGDSLEWRDDGALRGLKSAIEGMEMVSRADLTATAVTQGPTATWDEVGRLLLEKRDTRAMFERRLSSMWQQMGEEMGALADLRGQEEQVMIELMAWVTHLVQRLQENNQPQSPAGSPSSTTPDPDIPMDNGAAPLDGSSGPRSDYPAADDRHGIDRPENTAATYGATGELHWRNTNGHANAETSNARQPGAQGQSDGVSFLNMERHDEMVVNLDASSEPRRVERDVGYGGPPAQGGQEARHATAGPSSQSQWDVSIAEERGARGESERLKRQQGDSLVGAGWQGSGHDMTREWERDRELRSELERESVQKQEANQNVERERKREREQERERAQQREREREREEMDRAWERDRDLNRERRQEEAGEGRQPSREGKAEQRSQEYMEGLTQERAWEKRQKEPSADPAKSEKGSQSAPRVNYGTRPPNYPVYVEPSATDLIEQVRSYNKDVRERDPDLPKPGLSAEKRAAKRNPARTTDSALTKEEAAMSSATHTVNPESSRGTDGGAGGNSSRQGEAAQGPGSRKLVGRPPIRPPGRTYVEPSATDLVDQYRAMEQLDTNAPISGPAAVSKSEDWANSGALEPFQAGAQWKGGGQGSRAVYQGGETAYSDGRVGPEVGANQGADGLPRQANSAEAQRAFGNLPSRSRQPSPEFEKAVALEAQESPPQVGSAAGAHSQAQARTPQRGSPQGPIVEQYPREVDMGYAAAPDLGYRTATELTSAKEEGNSARPGPGLPSLKGGVHRGSPVSQNSPSREDRDGAVDTSPPYLSRRDSGGVSGDEGPSSQQLASQFYAPSAVQNRAAELESQTSRNSRAAQLAPLNIPPRLPIGASTAADSNHINQGQLSGAAGTAASGPGTGIVGSVPPPSTSTVWESPRDIVVREASVRDSNVSDVLRQLHAIRSQIGTKLEVKSPGQREDRLMGGDGVAVQQMSNRGPSPLGMVQASNVGPEGLISGQAAGRNEGLHGPMVQTSITSGMTDMPGVYGDYPSQRAREKSARPGASLSRESLHGYTVTSPMASVINGQDPFTATDGYGGYNASTGTPPLISFNAPSPLSFDPPSGFPSMAPGSVPQSLPSTLRAWPEEGSPILTELDSGHDFLQFGPTYARESAYRSPLVHIPSSSRSSTAAKESESASVGGESERAALPRTWSGGMAKIGGVGRTVPNIDRMTVSGTFGLPRY